MPLGKPGECRMTSLILLGDVNLMNVDGPRRAVPADRAGIARGRSRLRQSRMLSVPAAGAGIPSSMRGFSPIPQIAGEALRIAGIAAVGIANNVNYGSRGDPRLDRRTRPARDRPYRRRRESRSGLGAGCRRIGRDAGRVRAAQLGLLADQPRGDRDRRRHRGVARPHGLSGSGAQDPARDPADEPARRAARSS